MKTASRNLALAALAAGVLFAAPRAEAQVSVDVDVTIGGITILYYYNDIDINIDSTVLAGLAACNSITNGIGCTQTSPTPATTASGTQLNWDGNIDGATLSPDLSALRVNLQDVWAIRAIGGGSANTTVTVGGATDIDGGANGTIAVNTRLIDNDTDACDAGGGASADVVDSLGTPAAGSVCLELDLSGVTGAGTFQGTGDSGDAVYTLSITAT